MAFGFTPKYIENLPLNELTKEQFLVIATETAKEMKWEINYISENGFIAYTNKGMFSWNAEIEVKINFSDGFASIKSSSTGNEMMDWGKNKKNVEAFLSVYRKLKPTFTPENLEFKLQELKTEMRAYVEEDILNLPPQTTTEQISDFFSIFKPTENYFISPILLNINILLFILMVCYGVNVVEPTGESLLHWGANFRPITLEGEWWRLLSSCFLHIGIFHLLMNMYALMYIGLLLEPYLGKTRFISAYLLTGIAASITSLWWHENTISAGASGAIFGMYGVFLAMLTTNLIEKKARKALLTSIAFFVGYNLIYGLKGGIDNAAHIGGLACGILIGYAFIPSLKKPEEKNIKYSTIGIIAVVTLCSSFAVYKNISNDIQKYEDAMKKFVEIENMALDAYRITPATPKDQVLTLIKDKGIYYWNENIKLLNKVDNLDLPDELYERNKVLKHYCELRIKNYELIYKAVSEETKKYEVEITNYDAEIRAIITNMEVQKEEFEQQAQEQYE